jgi:hypothetical protein
MMIYETEPWVCSIQAEGKNHGTWLGRVEMWITAGALLIIVNLILNHYVRVAIETIIGAVFHRFKFEMGLTLGGSARP